MGIGKLEESCIEVIIFSFYFVLKEFSILGKDFELVFTVVRKYLYSLLVLIKSSAVLRTIFSILLF